MLDLLLASTSRYRRTLLERLGVPFRVRAPEVDEDAFKSLALRPRELAERLAFEKVGSLTSLEPQATIIGSDQLVAFEGRVLGKPGSVERAIDQLQSLSGRSHELVTAVVVWHRGSTWRHTDIATLTMRELTRDELERYVRADEPIDCAGSYKLEQHGVSLFVSIVSADHSAITGLPLIALTSILREIGYRIP